MPVKDKYFPLGGGLDVATPAISVKPGRLLSCSNFEPDVEGGYRWVPGYERYDGSERPHEQSFWGVEVEVFIPDSFPHTVDGKEYVTKAEWLASIAPLWDDTSSYLIDLYGSKRTPSRLIKLRASDAGNTEGFARICGFTDTAGELVTTVEEGVEYSVGVFKLSGSMKKGQLVDRRFKVLTDPVIRAAPTQRAENNWLRVVRNSYREAIHKPPGSGPIRGVWCLGNTVYSWRDDQRGDKCIGYKAKVLKTRSRRLLFSKYQDVASIAAAGHMTLFNRAGSNALSGQADYLNTYLIELHASGDGLTSGAADVDMSSGFKFALPGDVVRLKGDDDSGNILEFVLLSKPTLVATKWRLEVEVQYAVGPITGADLMWIVELETGVFDTSGWEQVADDRLLKALRFDAGTDTSATSLWDAGGKVWFTSSVATAPVAGSTTATVQQVVDWAGGYSTSDAVGLIYLSDITNPGTLADNSKIFVDVDGDPANALHIGSAKGTTIDFSLPAGAKFRFDTHNFYATEGTERVYATGGGIGFELDESGYFAQIVIPTVDDIVGIDVPSNGLDNKMIMPVEHGGHLFIGAEGGRLLNSTQGQPLNFSALLSAAEYGLGHEIVGVESITGGVLVIATTSNAKALYGNASDGWELRTVSEKEGILLDSIRKVDDVYGLSWAGISGLTRTEQFGDFNSDTISNAVAPLLKDLEPFFSTASIVKRNNLYRLHYSGKRPHYELGVYRDTATASDIDSATEAGAVKVQIAQVLSGSQDSGQRTLLLPRTKAMQWVESAAGGDTHKVAKTYEATVSALGAGEFHVDTDSFKIYHGSGAEAKVFFNRNDKSADDYRGTTIVIHTIADAIVGVFTVDKRTAQDTNTTTFSGSFRGGDDTNTALTLTAGTSYDLVLTATPLIDSGAGGSLAVSSRARDHFFDVLLFESKGGADPDSSTDPAQCLVTVRRSNPADDDFLDGSNTEELALSIKVNQESTTETIVMYVPERIDAADSRGVQTDDRVQFGRTVFPVAIDAVWECASPAGERIFFSGADGLVYEDRVGLNFDGAAITGFLRSPFIHLGMPSTIKRFRQLDIELATLFSLQFKVVMDLDFSAASGPSLIRDDERTTGQGGFWDTGDVWDAFDWDGVSVAFASVDLVGSGVNASFLLSFTSDNAQNLVLQGMLLHYSPRRKVR